MTGGTGWRIGVVGVCLVGGTLLGTARSYSHGSYPQGAYPPGTYSRGEDIRNRSVDLSILVKEAGRRVAVAGAKAATAAQDIDFLADADASPQLAKVRQQVAALRPAAALTPVTGPALRVSMSDAPRDSDGNFPVGVDPDDLIVHQQDVQSVVNALWAGGAEAMTIMDQRVVTTSAVRCIGNTLLLAGRTYSPPFLVTAIGNADRMAGALAAEPGVTLLKTYVQKFGLGFQIDPVDTVTFPAYAGLIRLTAAHQEKR